MQLFLWIILEKTDGRQPIHAKMRISCSLELVEFTATVSGLPKVEQIDEHNPHLFTAHLAEGATSQSVVIQEADFSVVFGN